MTLAAANYPINCGMATSTFTRAFEKRAIADRKFDITASAVQRVLSAGSSTEVTYNAAGASGGTPLKVFTRSTSAGYVTDFLVGFTSNAVGYFQNLSFASDSPSVLASPSGGVATYQSSGQCVLRATSEDGESSAVAVTASAGNPSTVEVFSRWASGTLAAHCSDQIAGLVAGKTSLNVFSVANGTQFVRNPNCWANGVDLSCASPWNSTSGSQRAGTLISRRHALFCAHAAFYPAVGATIWFVSQSGEVVTRTLSAVAGVEGADFVVGLLSSDVPESIGFARVLPTNWATYLPGLSGTTTVPVLCLNQTDRATISGLRDYGRVYVLGSSAYPDYAGSIVVGDSGNPVFLIVNGQPVIVGVYTTPATGSGASYYTSAINTAMASLGGGYQLTPVTLSSFSTH